MKLFRYNEFNALLVEPELPPREVWVNNNRAGVLAYIGGEAITKFDVPGDSACYLYNAAPPGDGRRLNRAVSDEESATAFIITGPFLVAGRLDGDKLCGLCYEQMDTYRRLFFTPHVFVRQNNTIVPWRL